MRFASARRVHAAQLLALGLQLLDPLLGLLERRKLGAVLDLRALFEFISRCLQLIVHAPPQFFQPLRRRFRSRFCCCAFLARFRQCVVRRLRIAVPLDQPVLGFGARIRRDLACAFRCADRIEQTNPALRDLGGLSLGDGQFVGHRRLALFERRDLTSRRIAPLRPARAVVFHRVQALIAHRDFAAQRIERGPRLTVWPRASIAALRACSRLSDNARGSAGH
jgi:hypothetical protein